MLHRATARICLELDIEEGQDPSGALVEELSDFLRGNSLVDLFKIKPMPEPAEATDTDEYGYEDALPHLEGLGDQREDGKRGRCPQPTATPPRAPTLTW